MDQGESTASAHQCACLCYCWGVACLRVAGNGAAGEALLGAKRKKFFWSKANRAGRSFTPEHVWTICMYQVC